MHGDRSFRGFVARINIYGDFFTRNHLTLEIYSLVGSLLGSSDEKCRQINGRKVDIFLGRLREMRQSTHPEVLRLEAWNPGVRGADVV